MTTSQFRTVLISLLAVSAVTARADGVHGGVAGADKQFAPTMWLHSTTATALVILTAEAVDASKIAKAGRSDFKMAYLNDPAVLAKDNIVFGVDEKNEISMNATLDGVQNVDSSGEIFGSQGMLTANCTTNSRERIACHVSRPENPNANAKKWSLDVSFDSALLPLASQ